VLQVLGLVFAKMLQKSMLFLMDQSTGILLYLKCAAASAETLL